MAEMTAKTPTPKPSPIRTALPQPSRFAPDPSMRKDLYKKLARAPWGSVPRVKLSDAKEWIGYVESKAAEMFPGNVPEQQRAKEIAITNYLHSAQEGSLQEKMKALGITTIPHPAGGVLGKAGKIPVPTLEQLEQAEEAGFTISKKAKVAAKERARVASAQEKYEREVLPALPREYQEAYKSRDVARMEKLAKRYQVEYDEWASQFTPTELKEIQSGRYQVLDFDTNQFVAVPKRVYEEREILYRQYPEAGTGPGKIPLPEAIEARRATIRDLDAGGHVITELETQYPQGGAPFEVVDELSGRIASYNLVGALQAGFDESRLRTTFGNKPVDVAKIHITDIKLIEKYPSVEAIAYTKDEKLVDAAKRLFGEDTVATVFETLFPKGYTGAWWYKDKQITSDERARLISEYESAPFGQKPPGGHPADMMSVVDIPVKTAAFYEDIKAGIAKGELALESIIMEDYASPRLDMTVDKLDEIASADFAKKGWTGTDRLAVDITMTRLGHKDPGVATLRGLTDEQKQEIADAYMTAPELLQEKAGGAIQSASEAVDQWVSDPSTEVGKVLRPFLAGGADIALGLTTIGTQVMKAAVSPRPSIALAELATIPLGMASWLIVQTPAAIAVDPLAGTSRFIGQIALPIASPRIIGTAKMQLGKTMSVTRAMITKGGTLARAIRTGTADVYAIRVPPDYFRGFTVDQLKQVFESGLKGKEQIAKAAELMSPETRVAFLSTIELTSELSKFKVPEAMYRSAVDTMTQVKGVNLTTAQAIVDWAVKNKSDVVFKGSTADYVQGMNLKPGDFDVVVKDGGKMTPELARRQLRKMFKDTGSRWSDKLFDIAYESKYAVELPYGWKAPDVILIDGVRFQALGGQFINRGAAIVTPGVEAAKGLMPLFKGKRVTQAELLARGAIPGVKVGTVPGRIKDVFRYQMEAQTVIQLLRKARKTTEANKLQALLDKFMEYEHAMMKGEVKPLPPDMEAVYKQTFLDLVGDLQIQALRGRGVSVRPSDLGKPPRAEVSLTEPRTGGILTRTLSPASRYIPETVYTAVRDIRPYQRAAQRGYLEAGYLIDEAGKMVKAPRPEIFTSPDAAFLRMRDFEARGKLPENAGIVAIRLNTAIDVGRGKAISPAFRFEYLKDARGKTYPVVYDELVLREGVKAYTTDPTVRSLSSKSVSNGKTGETVTYDPLSFNRQVPIMWFATEAASKLKLGAPHQGLLRTMNWMAIKGMLADLLHPHISRVVIGKEVPKTPQSLIQFYKDTYRWKAGSRTEIAKAIARENESILREAVGLVKRDRPDLYKEGGKQYSDTVFRQMREITRKRENELLRDSEAIRDMLKSVDPETIGRYYVVNLSKLIDTAILSGLAASATAPLHRVSTPTLPKPEITPAVTSALTTVPETATLSLSRVLVPSSPTKPVPAIPSLTVVLSDVPTTVTGITEPTTPTVPTVPTELVTPTIPTVTPTPTVPTIPAVTPTLPPPTLISLRAKIVGKEAKLPEGSIAWRQGMFWKWIPHQDFLTGRKPRTLRKGITPMGARFTNLRYPQETIQMIGDPEAPVPDISIDLGIADIYVSNQAQSIRYEGKGLETDVGERVPGPATGMSIPVAGDVGHAYAREIYPARSVSRTAISKEAPPRKAVKGEPRVRGISRPKIAESTKAMLEGTYEEPAEVEPDLVKTRENDFSGLLELSDADMDDIFGTGERKRKPAKNRVRHKRTEPVRGRDDNLPTMTRGVRP